MKESDRLVIYPASPWRHRIKIANVRSHVNIKFRVNYISISILFINYGLILNVRNVYIYYHMI